MGELKSCLNPADVLGCCASMNQSYWRERLLTLTLTLSDSHLRLWPVAGREHTLSHLSV